MIYYFLSLYIIIISLLIINKLKRMVEEKEKDSTVVKWINLTKVEQPASVEEFLWTADVASVYNNFNYHYQ